MAESAKILSPEKTVLLPELRAGCPMADMVDAQSLIEEKKRHPGATVLCYINSSAEVKAQCDVCCTSSNAVAIVKKIESDEILFVPDKNLSKYVASKVPEKNIIFWEGYCPTHDRIGPENVMLSKERHPRAQVLIHPECRPEVCALADFVGSTKEIIDYASGSLNKEFIIGTEMGVLYSLRKNNPDKKFYILDPNLVCPNMKVITKESVYNSLKENIYEIRLSGDIIEGAKKPLENMLRLTGK